MNRQADIDLYMDKINDIYILPHADLARLAAHPRRNRHTLWLQGVKLVAKIAHRLTNMGLVESAEWLDLVQEGNLAIPRAIDSWEPLRGTFSTWIGVAVEGAMLDYANKAGTRSGGLTGARDERPTVVTDVQVEGGQEPDSTPPSYLVDFDYTPTERVLLNRLLDLLCNERERKYVRLHYFQNLNHTEMTRYLGVSRMTVYRVLASAIAKLNVTLP